VNKFLRVVKRVSRERKGITKYMKVWEAIFLSGIPIFGFFSVFAVGRNQVEFLGIINDKIGDLIILFFASLFCALSILSVDELYEAKAEGTKSSRTFIFLSALFLVVSVTITSILKPEIFIFPILIYLNWIIYYEVRRVIEFPDIFLHLSGGVLQFLFGVFFASRSLNMEKLLLSLFVSFAFTGGYISDLAEDIEEDREIGQKNLAEKIGEKKSLVLSFLFFLASYLLGFYLAYKEIFPKWFIPSSVMIHLIFLLLTLKSKIGIPTYRLIYRGIFTLCGLIFLLHNLT